VPIIILVGGITRQIFLTRMPSPPLKSTVQSQSGVVRIVEAQVRPLIAAIPRFIQETNSPCQATEF
jgi:hypothetical protein